MLGHKELCICLKTGNKLEKKMSIKIFSNSHPFGLFWMCLFHNISGCLILSLLFFGSSIFFLTEHVEQILKTTRSVWIKTASLVHGLQQVSKKGGKKEEKCKIKLIFFWFHKELRVSWRKQWICSSLCLDSWYLIPLPTDLKENK